MLPKKILIFINSLTLILNNKEKDSVKLQLKQVRDFFPEFVETSERRAVKSAIKQKFESICL